ncbi:MAG: hypothetical protein NZ920_03185 [Aigarchaeota archaeon]|nr:hypothetical protein [Aigarchaeota archaeon]MDW8092377.1 hypothetical protein [Nitrososphaerota archaeon]
MVLTAKVFDVRSESNLGQIAAKLKDLKLVERVKEGESEIELVTDVSNLKSDKSSISGVLSKDKLMWVRQRGKRVPVVRTIDAYIEFRDRGDKILLIVLQEKHFANAVASLLSHQLFLDYRSIVEANIPSENIQKLHEANPEATKLIWFDQLRIPGVEKLALAGPSLMDVPLYREYVDNGRIWYIVYTTRDGGRIFGLTRNAVVTAFTRLEESEFLDYIHNEVFRLIV